MTFEDIRKLHKLGGELRFTHPELPTELLFDAGGRLRARNKGRDTRISLKASDFDRTDWGIRQDG